VIPAVIGGVVALGGSALVGRLSDDSPATITVAGSPSELAAAAETATPSAPDVTPDAGGARSVQQIFRERSPGVVTVTVGDGPNPSSGRLGTGFVIDGRRHILTNAHVVDTAKTTDVSFEDGTTTTAKVLGTDRDTDLAVLEVKEVPKGVQALPLGSISALEVGDPVVAIGNPLGFAQTVTTGIVSALERFINSPSGFRIQNVVQTDAAINQGNSGGPLLDGAGRVIGINTQIASESGGNVGIGFAVPIDTIRPVADSIIATGTAQHAWIGISGVPMTPEVATKNGTPDLRGVMVAKLDKRGPAKKAGLKEATSGGDSETVPPKGGDVIVRVGGRPVRDMADVSQAVASRRVGESLTFEVIREGKAISTTLTLANRPSDVR
jgi:S1-C subfamily serine protease